MGVLVKKSGNRIIEDRVLTLSEATSMQITLTNTPQSTADVMLDFPNGTAQRNGFDFTVVGNVLSWSGYSLETLLEQGDVLRINYTI